MGNLFSVFHKIIVIGGAVVSSVLPLVSPHANIVPHIAITPTVVNVGTDTVHRVPTININKTVNTMGKEVTISLTMPKDGGTVEGTISGDCQGNIDGVYSGKPDNTFNGKGQVTCTFGFLSLPADTTFTGVIHPDQKTTDIHYSITSGSNFSKTGDVTVSYTE